MNTFYNGAHRFYCGVDLHKKIMYLCILNERGETVFHKNIRSRPADFLSAIAPFREDLVVAVECMFIADGSISLMVLAGRPLPT